MTKSLIFCSLAFLAIFSARCQTTPTRIDSTSQPRDNRVVANKATENHSEANRAETNSAPLNSETANRNSPGNAESKPIIDTNSSESNSAVNRSPMNK